MYVFIYVFISVFMQADMHEYVGRYTCINLYMLSLVHTSYMYIHRDTCMIMYLCVHA